MKKTQDNKDLLGGSFEHQLCNELIEQVVALKKVLGQYKKIITAVEQGPLLVIMTDRYGVIEYVNSRALTQSMYQKEELIGKDLRILQANSESIDSYKLMWDKITRGSEWRGQLLNKDKRGDFYTVSAVVSPLRNDNEITNYLVIMENISQKRSREALLKYQAFYDSLTNLPNRFYGYNKLDQAIDKATLSNKKIAILFIDLDNFKQINKSFGHTAGDALLKILSDRYLSLMKENDTLIRLGGDEFMVILEELRSEKYAKEIAQKCQNLSAMPFNLESKDIYISSSIGISIFPKHGTDAKTLMCNADIAMYQSKVAGKNNWAVFDKSVSELVTDGERIKTELSQVLSRDELYICYQPIINMHDGSVYASEALLRWKSESLGQVMPDQIIPIAEEAGLIVPLGYWVLKKVCSHIKEWQEHTSKDIKIAVNVSAIQLKQKDFVSQVRKIIQEADISPSSLIFEITESAFIDDTKLVLTQLNKLNKMSIDCSLDDFGMGYSSLNYIRSYTFKSLKIDRAFIQGIDSNEDDLSLVRSIINLCKNLNLTVIAEGIETFKQFELLRAMNCDMVQGWYFSKALSKRDLLVYLNNK